MLIDQRQFKNATPFALEANDVEKLQGGISAIAVHASSAATKQVSRTSIDHGIRALFEKLGIKLRRLSRRVRAMSRRRLRRANHAARERRHRDHHKKLARRQLQATQVNQLLALEPRIVFDAATADHVADQVAEQQAADAVEGNHVAETAADTSAIESISAISGGITHNSHASFSLTRAPAIPVPHSPTFLKMPK